MKSKKYKHCAGCAAFEGCRFEDFNTTGMCPCGKCLIKVMCNDECELVLQLMACLDRARTMREAKKCIKEVLKKEKQ